METLRLIGVAVVVLGFALRLRVTVVVLAAGIATGLVAKWLDGDSGPGILATLGTAFVNGRIITLVVLALPALGLLERYGLPEEAARVIRKFGAATVGRVLLSYHLFRTAVVAVGIRLSSGQAVFSRPVVVPMGLAAAQLDGAVPGTDGTGAVPGTDGTGAVPGTDGTGAVPGTDGAATASDAEAVAEEVDRIKAVSSASDNYANFFGQNLFFGSPGIALVVKNLADNGYAVSALHLAMLSIPMAVAALVFATVQYALLDRWLRRRQAARTAAGAGVEGAP